MFQAIRHYRLHTGLAPQQALAPLLRLVRRVLTPRNRLGDDLPDSLKRDLGLPLDRLPRDRADAYWLDRHRRGGWMRFGPL